MFFHVINMRDWIRFDEETLIEFEGYSIDIAPGKVCCFAFLPFFSVWSVEFFFSGSDHLWRFFVHQFAIIHQFH